MFSVFSQNGTTPQANRKGPQLLVPLQDRVQECGNLLPPMPPLGQQPPVETHQDIRAHPVPEETDGMKHQGQRGVSLV